LVEHQRVAWLAANHIRNRNVFSRRAFRHSNRAVMASRNHHHVTHVALTLIGQKVPDPKLHKRSRQREAAKFIRSRAILVEIAAGETRWRKCAPGALKNEVVTQQRTDFRQYRGMINERLHCRLSLVGCSELPPFPLWMRSVEPLC